MYIIYTHLLSTVCYDISTFLSPSVARVGLEQTFFSVMEDVGVVELCARVFEPADPDCPIEFPFDVRLTTRDDTAGRRHVHTYPFPTSDHYMCIISIISLCLPIPHCDQLRIHLVTCFLNNRMMIEDH